jgi:hypothetical protein
MVVQPGPVVDSQSFLTAAGVRRGYGTGKRKQRQRTTLKEP